MQSSKLPSNGRSLSKGKKTKPGFKYVPKNGTQTAMALTDEAGLRVSLDRVSSAERKRASVGSRKGERSNQAKVALSAMNTNIVSM